MGVSRRKFLASAAAAPLAAQSASEPAIDIWYGARQRFGVPSLPQPWINILGRVSPSEDVTLTGTVNGGSARNLTVGPDQHRLASPGDFNFDIHESELTDGDNDVVIQATTAAGQTAEAHINVDLQRGGSCSLPHEVDWPQVDNIQDVAQIVDGHWALQNGGVRTLDPAYDRVLAFGEPGWADYRVLAEVTIHGFVGKSPGPPVYNVNHAGITLRWRGHGDDGRQPRRHWYPLGAATEFTLEPVEEECRWRILPGPPKRHVWAEHVDAIQIGRPYLLVSEVKTLDDGRHRYRSRLQELDRNWFDRWSVESIEEPETDFGSGCCLLIAHQSDVTFGRVRFEPI